MRLVILIVGLILLVSPVGADERFGVINLACDMRPSVVKHLWRVYRETPHLLGITNSGGLVEAFVSAEGTWTMIITYLNGVSCLVLAGTDWEGDGSVVPTGSGRF